MTVTRINMHGPPGSGKTCSQCLLRNEKPPAEVVTDSTPIACRAVKATKASIRDDGCLKEVDSYDVLVALESDLNAHQHGTPSNINIVLIMYQWLTMMKIQLKCPVLAQQVILM